MRERNASREPDVELERYELFEHPRYEFAPWDVHRRDFLKTLSAGLVILFVVPRDGVLAQQESGRGGGQNRERMPADVSAWLHIEENGAITGFTGKTEIGQNIRTSLTQAIAEELKVPVASVTLVMADTARTPFDQGTFGSRTTPTMNLQLRKVAAAARQVLMQRATEKWKTAPATLTQKDIAALVKDAPLVAIVSDTTPLEPAKDWTIAGTAVPKVNGRDFVTGRHQYTSDLKVDGMLHGRIVRPPSYGATLSRVQAPTTSGVFVVHEGNFLGVAAPTVAAANAAADAIEAEWTPGSTASARTLYDDLRRTAGNAPASGPPDATYTVAYIAHAPLEPRAAVAEWNGDRLTVWTGTQRPFGVQQELADAFHTPLDRIRVVVPDVGAAYGGKHTGDAAIEAARLARAAGKPVKLVWTREEEFRWAYFRPAGVIDVRAAVDKTGRLTSWEFDNYNSGPAALQTPYAVATKREQFHQSESPLRQGSYRGLAATANHFARESHMDDLAHAAGIDPLDFRLMNLRDDRLSAALKAAADRFGWKGPAKAGPYDGSRSGGSGIGLACGVEKGGYTACCVELRVANGAVALTRVVVAFECGAIVNPGGLNNQVEGAIIQGLGGALFEAIDFENGALTNPHFASYRLPRFRDVPPIDVVLLDRRDLPSAGAGETPIVGLAPAIGNAIFRATGTRVRSLPLIPGGALPTTHP